MKHTLSACLVALLCSLCILAHAAPPGGYRITDFSSTLPDPDLRRTVFSVQQGREALNRFHVVRVRQTGIGHLTDSPVILLSPFGFPSEFWEVTKLHVYRDAFAARLALSGYDVWLVDDRLANVAPAGCESGAVDCSPMAEWGMDRAVADALFVRDVVRVAHPLKQPVLGGFSGGSSVAIATVNRDPRNFSGLLMWEGTIFTQDPAIRARNAAFCHDDDARLAAGVFADPSVQGFKALFTLASAAPGAPSPIPIFPPGTTSLQALLFAFTVPAPTNPLSFTDTFIRLVGDPFAGLVYSDVNRLLELGPLVGNYAPVRFIRDSHCAIAGIDGSFSDNLGAFRGDVLVYAEGHGFGQMMIDTSNQMTRARVTLDHHPDFGESDPYFHVDWPHVAVDPLVSWLGQVRFVGR